MVTVFEQGDIILLDFDPQVGHEQRGRRPAFVVSNDVFNNFTKAAIVCPITSTDRNLSLQVRLDYRTRTQGVVMCEQVKALDLTRRNSRFLEKAPPDVTGEVVDMVFSFIEM